MYIHNQFPKFFFSYLKVSVVVAYDTATQIMIRLAILRSSPESTKRVRILEEL